MSKLTKTHVKMLVQLFEEDKMPEAFYVSLEKAFEEKNYACLDVKRIIERNPDVSRQKAINDFFSHRLNTSWGSAIRKILKIHPFTEDELEALLPDQYTDWDSFMIIGCPDSTDIDVVAHVRPQDHQNGQIQPLSSRSKRNLHAEIKKLGYDLTRKVDLCLIYVDPDSKMIIASSKGSTETQNIMLSTWRYHKQVIGKTSETGKSELPLLLELHPVIEIEFTDKEIRDKIRAFAKFMLDNAEDICIDYQAFRPTKIELYSSGGNTMMQYMSMDKIGKYIQLNPEKFSVSTYPRWHDRFKTIIMKLLQILLLFRANKTEYIKSKLATCVHDIFEQESLDCKTLKVYESCALWFLFRGNRGKFCPELFPRLLTAYSEIVEQFLDESDLIKTAHALDTILDSKIYPDSMNSELMTEFFASPIYASSKFESTWTKVHEVIKSGSDDNSNVNNRFILKSSDPVKFFARYNKLNPKIISVLKNCFIFVDQRSPMWLEMLENKFVCGNNGGTIGINFQAKYNLIRGAVMEDLAIKLLDPKKIGLENFEKWSLGFVVQENKKGSPGFAPDLILFSDDGDVPEFILVEIKGLRSSRRNTDYYRELHLAHKQIRSGQEILSKHLNQDELLIKRSLIVMCYIEESRFNMEVQLVEL